MSFRCLDCGREHGDGESCQWCGFVPASISERERAKAAVQAALRTLAEARKARDYKGFSATMGVENEAAPATLDTSGGLADNLTEGADMSNDSEAV